MRKIAVVLVGILTFVAGVTVGWTAREVAAYDNCLDRINYDKALWHLCDSKEPRDPQK